MISELAQGLWRATGYEPHEKAMLYHEAGARFSFPACGRRFGKSLMVEKDWLPDLFDEDNPGRFWMVALSYDTCDEFQYLWEDVVMKLGLGSAPGLKAANNVRTGEMFLQFPWGTRVDVKSAMKPATLVGKGLKRVLLSEAAKMPPIIWHKYVSPALADHRGRADFPSTPEGFNWYYEEWLKGQSEGELYGSWNFPSWENRVIYPDGFDDPEIQRQLPKNEKGEVIDDPWFWQELGADFRTMAGLIYPEFNRQVHVKRMEFDPALPTYEAFDWGFTAPLVALDVQVTPTEEVRVLREYVEPGQPVHVHAETLRQRGGPPGYKPRIGFGDSADPDAVETMGRMWLRTIARPEAKDVKAGIRAVKEWLRPPSSKPKLFIDPSCVNTIREFESYRMKVQRGLLTNSAAEQEIKDEPLKRDDHCMDALRYLIMHLFKLPGYGPLDDMWESEGVGKEPGVFTWDGGMTLGDGMTLGRRF